jgi:tetratricopeptide (TPR) repeat protein
MIMMYADDEVTTSSYQPIFDRDPYGYIVAMMVALAAILATVIGYMDVKVNAEASQVGNQAQQYAIQAMGLKSRGEVETGYAWTEAYRQWLTWDTKATLARQSGDEATAKRYEAVRDKTTKLTPLLTAPYFDQQTDNQPNLRAFEADAYLVQAITLQELFSSKTALSDAFSAKSDVYTMNLLLLAIAISIYALSSDDKSLKGWRGRWVPVVVSSTMVIFIFFWAIITYFSPVVDVPESAIESYAKGVGAAYQGDFSNAVVSFDQALESYPDYANAYYRRANAHFDLTEYQKAAEDYETAMKMGRGDVNVLWNLGWTYYVLGQPEQAIEITKQAIELNEEQVALKFNLGLAYLAKCDIETAESIYEAALETAAQQVTQAKENGEEAPVSLWWYLEVANKDLGNLLNCLTIQTCQESPPYNTVPTSDQLVSTGRSLRVELKNNAVALEHLGKPLGPPVAVTISPLEFLNPVYDNDNNLTDFTALQTDVPQMRFGRVQEETGEVIETNVVQATIDHSNQIFVRFDYTGLQDGQLFVMKLYNDGEESPGLRVVEPWQHGGNGQVALPLTPGTQFALAPGDYRVEFYVEAHLVQEGVFAIE